MSPEEAINLCTSYPLFGPVRAIIDHLEAWVAGDIPAESMFYVFNMLSSKNILWIDCMATALSTVSA